MRIFKILLSLLAICTEVTGHEHSKLSFLQTHPNYVKQDVQDYISDDFISDPNDFSVLPTSFLDGQDVTVQWKNKPNPENKDFLGLSCGRKTSGMDFLDKVSVGNVTGSGSYTFSGLINMRCNYSIEYIETDKNWQKQTSEISLPPRNGLNEPMHIHTSFTNDPTKMNIMWTSFNDYLPQLKLWSLKDLLNNNWNWDKVQRDFNGTLKGKYSNAKMCGSPANSTSQEWYRDPGYQKLVVIDKLERGGYYYMVGDDKFGWSKKFDLSIDENNPDKTSFLAYGDLGIDAPPAAQGTINRIMNLEGNDFVLHFGDISYARGKGWIWERFFRMIEPLASYTPYKVFHLYTLVYVL